MKFSLILATVGRISEVEEFLKSLVIQEYKEFELIIVDQNEHNKIYELYNKYKKFYEIKYIKAESKGLSRARNIGLKYINGEIVSFPDDDCEYDKNTLLDIVDKFKKVNLNIVTFKIVDKQTGLDSCGKWPENDQEILYKNVFNTAISITIFVKYKNINDIYFDEKLGVGTYFSSGEETDLVLRLIGKGYIGKYYSDILIYHPNKRNNFDRGYQYGLGTGAIYYKEILLRRNYLFSIKYILAIVAPMMRIIIFYLVRKKDLAIYNFQVLKGRIRGFIEYKS